LTLNFNSKAMQYKMSFDGQGRHVIISSENVLRTNKDQSAEIAWTKSFNETFLLPAAGTFVALSAKANAKDVEILFSDPIADFDYGTQYTFAIEEGFPSAYGTKTKDSFIEIFEFKDEKPQISWVGSGLFLPLENKGRLQLKSINLSGARLEIQEILPQNLIFFLQNKRFIRVILNWIALKEMNGIRLK